MHVIATAGHVDHGKSTLVRALTGMEPDRLAEERRRGLTIELGYVWTRLPSGELLAFVDVPGHQRFIGTMLAGLGPTPAVLFVVAADEGWSRQSDEHLAAIEALQVRHGVLAVTRADLADPAPVLADARRRLAAGSLGDVTAVAVSGRTGAGLDELRTALDDLLTALPAPDTAAPVRLWLDRSFSVRGAGTVVTGTLAAGTVATGDTLELQGRPVTVRGIQSAGAEHERVDAVARVALNLRGVPATEPGRGDVLLTPDAWWHTDTVDVRLDPPGPQPAELVAHVGTAAVAVRVRPLDDHHARLTLATPLPLRRGDRAVLRNPGAQAVAAGALVLDADPPALTRRGAAAARARELLNGPSAADEVRRRGTVRRDHLRRLGLPTGSLRGVHEHGPWLVHDDIWQEWLVALPDALDGWGRAHPLDPAPPVAALRDLLAVPDADLTRALVVAAGLRVGDGRVTRPGAAPRAVPANVRALLDRLAGDPFAAPERDDLAALRLGRRELAAAAKDGHLLRLADDIVLAPAAVELARDRLAALPQPFTTSAARQALGTTRRVAIPLLEHLDDIGLTTRVDTTSRTVVM